MNRLRVTACREFVRSGAKIVGPLSTMPVIKAVLGPDSHDWVSPMDAISTVSALDYSDAPPVLISGSSDICLMRATRTVRALGLRVGDAVPMEEAEGASAAISRNWARPE